MIFYHMAKCYLKLKNREKSFIYGFDTFCKPLYNCNLHYITIFGNTLNRFSLKNAAKLFH